MDALPLEIGSSEHLHRKLTCKKRLHMILHDLIDYKEAIVIVLAPILAMPLLLSDNSAYHCAYCVIVMGLYWMFEVMPLAVTALMPTFMFPMLGVLSAAETSAEYLTHLNFLFIGGLIIALAVEKCHLHQRIALSVLTIVGSQPKWIMLGFMVTTAFLSMWMSNTATAAMMVPIAQSVIQELIESNQKRADEKDASNGARKYSRKHSLKHDSESHDLLHHNDTGTEPPPAIDIMHNMKEEAKHRHIIQRQRSQLQQVTPALKQKNELNLDTMTNEEARITKGLMIAIAFASNIGGTGTITGTAPNLVLVDAFDKQYPQAMGMISFLAWMQFSIPLMCIVVLVCWLTLVIMFMGVSHLVDIFRRDKKHKADSVLNDTIQQKYKQLPTFCFAEVEVLILFGILLILWIFRDPKVIPGFGQLFKKGYYKDGTSAMLIAVILFILPDKVPAFLCLRSYGVKNHHRSKSKLRGTLMDWTTMQHKFPWSVVLLLGGGFALAAGVSKSGLSEQIGYILHTLEGIDKVWLQIICLVATIFVTNICSNTVTAVIFLQIVSEMADNLKIHPLAFMMPTVLACSYAFLLPVGTPPNAIVFASGLLTVGDMMKAGFVVTFVGCICILAYMNTAALLMWNLHEYPQWANNTS